jgi:YbbR domain-containing protein
MRKNLWVKVASVLFAVALWFFVISRGRAEVEVPVVYEHVPAGLHVMKDSTETVVVGVRGHVRAVKGLSLADVRVGVDMSAASAGENLISLDRKDVKLPMSLRVVLIRPAYVNVNVEETVRKTVPVSVFFTGRPREGLSVLKVEVVPDEAEVEGPGSGLMGLKAVNTVPVDISRAGETVVFKGVRIVEPGLDMKLDLKEVDVRVIIVGDGA